VAEREHQKITVIAYLDPISRPSTVEVWTSAELWQRRHSPPCTFRSSGGARGPTEAQSNGLADVDYSHAEFLGSAVDRQIALDSVVIRSEVAVIDRPVFACGLERSTLEVALTLASGHGTPQRRDSAEAAGALRVASVLPSSSPGCGDSGNS
jgi:hypothetical protein